VIMGRIHIVLMAAAVVGWSTLHPGIAQQSSSDQQELASQIEQRFNVLPVQSGVVLTPKGPSRGIRSIEVSNGGIAIDGTPVTGAELRRRLDADADLIIRLSYLDSSAQRALFESRQARPPAEATPEAPASAPPVVETPPGDESRPRGRGRRSNDRVRIGGGVSVNADETIDGDVVAIGGPANVEGVVHGDVVAIGGPVSLGPRADVQGDVTVIGGPLRRDPSARVNGEVHEIGLGDINFWPGWRRVFPAVGGSDGPFFGSLIGGVFPLIATLARLGVLCVLAAIVLLFGRGYVERVSLRAASEPMKAGAVGLLIQLLFFPVLIATIFVMLITIIGIPLLVLVPFALLAFALLFLIGFTAVAYDVGRFAAPRLRVEAQNPYAVAALGVALVLSPVLLSRLVGLTGGLLWPITWTLLLIGFVAEYLAWTVGLGAVALVRFDRRPAL
jgi:hypothetical protein